MENYVEENLTINAAKAQVVSLAYFLPWLVLFGVPFFLIWPERLTKSAYKAATHKDVNGLVMIAILFGVIILGIVVHELIHGITWSFFAKEGFKSIRFGVLWKSATPYCHCKEPLKVRAYIIGALMPLIILGILPLVAALITGSIFLLAFGLFFTMAAGGDMMIAASLRKVDSQLLVQDHPSEIGCILYRPA